ncbi:MAG TPA: hypothetical protein VNS52_00665 [Gemmatimonadaceae bacterium]|nr:hypothetical protein [Gemmatimonadaceae bacterium]
MHSFPRFGRRVRQVMGVMIVGVLVPALTLAQSATTTKKDGAKSAAVKPDSATSDSATTHSAAGKRSRLGALGRAAVSRASSAADKVEQTTGVSKETMAKAALAGTGVGAATLLAKPGAGSAQAQVGATVGRTVLQRVEDARAARAAAATPPSGMTAGAMTAEQMALYRQQMAMAQAAGGGMGAAGGSAEMQRLQLEYMQLTMRASSGDTVAAKQLMRFQQEMTTVGLRMQSVAPDKQQAAYESALRDALQCATSGRSCHAGRM